MNPAGQLETFVDELFELEQVSEQNMTYFFIHDHPELKEVIWLIDCFFLQIIQKFELISFKSSKPNVCIFLKINTLYLTEQNTIHFIFF